jgi:hypothetical protein
MKYTTIFILFLTSVIGSCQSSDSKDITSTDAKIQEILASEEFKKAYPVFISSKTSTDEALRISRIYDELLSSIREGITPETDIYDALRKAVATNLEHVKVEQNLRYLSE